MARRPVEFTVDAVSRAIKAVKKAGVEIRTIRVEPNGSVVINGDSGEITEEQFAEGMRGYL